MNWRIIPRALLFGSLALLIEGVGYDVLSCNGVVICFFLIIISATFAWE